MTGNGDNMTRKVLNVNVAYVEAYGAVGEEEEKPAYQSNEHGGVISKRRSGVATARNHVVRQL